MNDIIDLTSGCNSSKGCVVPSMGIMPLIAEREEYCNYEVTALLEDGSEPDFDGVGGTLWAGSMLLTLRFKQPTDVYITNHDTSSAAVIHTNQGGDGAMTTDGGDWLFTAGSFNPSGSFIDVSGKIVTPLLLAADPLSPSANDDWGQLVTFGAKNITIQAGATTAFKIHYEPTVELKKDVCELITDLQDQVGDIASNPATDTNTQNTVSAGANVTISTGTNADGETDYEVSAVVPSNTSDLVNDSGFITLSDIPPDMDTDVTAVSLSLSGDQLTASVFENGNTIPSVPITIPTTTVDKSYVAEYVMSGDGNASAVEELTLALIRQDTPFVEAGDRVTVNLDGDYLEISAMATYDVNTSGVLQRIAPELELVRTRGGADTILSESATGYQRHATGHDNSSNTIYRLVTDHVAGDIYRLRPRQGGTQNDTLPISIGHASFKLVEKITVFTP